jgi:hypothetical protein
MKTLRLLRNIAVLFILVMALLASRPAVQPSRAQNIGYSCYFDSSTVGYNCTFNANGTCDSSKCQPGQPCNNGICPKSCGYKKGHSCYIDANNQCRESACNRAFGCLNSGCI